MCMDSQVTAVVFFLYYGLLLSHTRQLQHWNADCGPTVRVYAPNSDLFWHSIAGIHSRTHVYLQQGRLSQSMKGADGFRQHEAHGQCMASMRGARVHTETIPALSLSPHMIHCSSQPVVG